MALLLPAIQAARESARRAECTNQMRQLILAVNDFEMSNEHLPMGTNNPTGPIENLPKGLCISWIARILPHLEEGVKYDRLDFSASAYATVNDPIRQTTIAVLECPSASNERGPFSNYAGSQNDVEAPINTDNNGVLFLNSQISRDDVKDGSGYTIVIGEKFIDEFDLGWLSGSPATLRNTGSPLNEKPDQSIAYTIPPWVHAYFDESAGGMWSDEPAYGQPEDESAAADSEKSPDAEPASPWSLLGGNPAEPLHVGGFGSDHIAGCNFAFGDGTVRFVSDLVEQRGARAARKSRRRAHRQRDRFLIPECPPGRCDPSTRRSSANPYNQNALAGVSNQAASADRTSRAASWAIIPQRLTTGAGTFRSRGTVVRRPHKLRKRSHPAPVFPGARFLFSIEVFAMTVSRLSPNRVFFIGLLGLLPCLAICFATTTAVAQDPLGDDLTTDGAAAPQQQLTAEDVQRMFKEGEEALKAEDFQSALKTYDTLIRILKQQGYSAQVFLPVVYTGRGQAFAGLEDVEAAKADYDEALKENSTHMPALIARGKLYYDLGAMELGLADFEAAKEQDRQNPDVMFGIGKGYVLLGGAQQAVKPLTYAIAANEDNAEAYRLRASLLRRRQKRRSQ